MTATRIALFGSHPLGEACLDVLAAHVPRWERARDPNWRETWRTRGTRLLGWLELAGLARRVDDGYVKTTDGA